MWRLVQSSGGTGFDASDTSTDAQPPADPEGTTDGGRGSLLVYAAAFAGTYL